MSTQIYRRVVIVYRWWLGLAVFLNFVVFWAVPIGLQGQGWRLNITKRLHPIYTALDNNKWLRSIANTYVYNKEVYSDFFAISCGLAVNTFVTIAVVLYQQIKYDTVPLWMVYAYYFMWVGLGGRGMGGVYTLTHKEGHHRNGNLYKGYIAKTFGNFWENWMGFFHGNVPFLFSTSHIYLHHRLNAGKGDPFYQWDFDRTSLSDFMLYLHRSTFGYMTGYESLKIFKRMAPTNKTMAGNFDQLLRGVLWYWFIMPAVATAGLLAAGCSGWSTARFMVLFYFEPFLAMSFFLAFINFSLHGFIEFDEDKQHIACVNSTCIMEGPDDYFGEDDHMAHHYYTAVTHRDLAAHQDTQKELWKKHVGSVFKEIAIPELSLFMMLNWWDMIAEKHFVDFTGKMSNADVAKLLKERAQRKEMSYEHYEFEYLPNLWNKAQLLVDQGKCVSVDQALKYIAHSNVLVEEDAKTD